jgi:hypothetical protein
MNNDNVYKERVPQQLTNIREDIPFWDKLVKNGKAGEAFEQLFGRIKTLFFQYNSKENTTLGTHPRDETKHLDRKHIKKLRKMKNDKKDIKTKDDKKIKPKSESKIKKELDNNNSKYNDFEGIFPNVPTGFVDFGDKGFSTAPLPKLEQESEDDII